MKLKGTINPAETIETEIVPGFVVDVAPITARARRKIARAHTSKKRKGAEIVDEFDGVGFVKERIKAQLPSWRGLTPEVAMYLLQLGVDDEIDVDVDGDGCIPCDHAKTVFTDEDGNAYSLPLLMWDLVPHEQFAGIIEATNAAYDELLAKQAAKKKTSCAD